MRCEVDDVQEVLYDVCLLFTHVAVCELLKTQRRPTDEFRMFTTSPEIKIICGYSGFFAQHASNPYNILTNNVIVSASAPLSVCVCV